MTTKQEPRTGQTTGDADTDLDALTRQYEAEAAAAKAKAVGGARRLVSEQRGMEERRADALATPLASDTRCA